MKLKVTVREANESDFKLLRERSLKRLAELKDKGYSKQDCYRWLSKKFVDENY